MGRSHATSSSSHSVTSQTSVSSITAPTRLQLFKASKWVCVHCDEENFFQNTSQARPLGRMTCRSCQSPVSCVQTVPSFGPYNFTRIQVKDFAISLPPGRITPHTLFIWACCKCGRSHDQIPKKPVPKPPKPEEKRNRLRKRVLDTAHKLRHQKEKESTMVITTPHNPDLGSNLRSGLVIHFDKACKCSHVTCEICLRFMARDDHSEDEWVTPITPFEEPKAQVNKTREEEERLKQIEDTVINAIIKEQNERLAQRRAETGFDGYDPFAGFEDFARD